MKKKQVRQSVWVSLFLLAVLFLLPLLVVRPLREELFDSGEPCDESHPGPEQGGKADSDTILRIKTGDQVVEMDLGTYLVGVVRAEMPASFEPEALKAQAVAARTYTFHQLSAGGKHGGEADLCTDPACCQAYTDEEKAKENWGRKAKKYEKKVREAVEETDGQIAVYGGAPILAVFHASSAGLTRAAGSVWQNDLPYLQPVDSPENADSVPGYVREVEITTELVQKQVKEKFPEADLSGPAEQWLSHAVRDDAGSIETISVGGVTMKGGTLRGLLGLRSACFTWKVEGDRIVFTVTGHGHGVGMSQYGAQAMAEDGADYREIVTHYYPGAELENYGVLG